jgi:hypothetical protein
MKQSEEATKIVADRHADQVQAQIRRIQEEAEVRKRRAVYEEVPLDG